MIWAKTAKILTFKYCPKINKGVTSTSFLNIFKSNMINVIQGLNSEKISLIFIFVLFLSQLNADTQTETPEKKQNI